MKTEASAQNTCVIWIDHPNRIVSFQKAEGFEPPLPPGLMARSVHFNLSI